MVPGARALPLIGARALQTKGRMAYDDSGDDAFADAAPPPTQSKPNDNRSEDDQADAGGEEVLIPKSACPGMEPGDLITFRITAAHDDQYSATYVREGDGEGEHAEPSVKRDEVGEMMS